MAANDIRHSGTIEQVGPSEVVVRIQSRSACGACTARSGCAMAETADKRIVIAVDDASDYRAGQEVEVCARPHQGLKAVAICYVGALVVLLAALFTTIGLLGWSEGAGIGATVAAVALYYGAVWLLRDKIAHTIQFSITKH